MESGHIADISMLEEWQSCRVPAAERQLNDRLRGVLAEIAYSGIIRYRWPLLRPLVAQLMLEQLTHFETAEHVEVGPARPLLEGAGSCQGAAAVAERFSQLLWSFTDAPWTLQRLCEVLLDPHKQYRRLHKLVLALEKLLLVTGEVAACPTPPPPPRLSDLVPPAAAAAGAARAAAGKRTQQDELDASGLVTATLVIRHPDQAAARTAGEQGTSTAAAARENAVPAADGSSSSADLLLAAEQLAATKEDDCFPGNGQCQGSSRPM